MPLTKRQVEGVVALVVITTLIYLSNLIISLHQSFYPVDVSVPFSNQKAGTNAVALEIDGIDQGIFFLPREATVSDLLTAARITPLPRILNEKIITLRLKAGQKVSFARGSNSDITVGKMSSAQTLALDLPLDINTATFNDLVLIPGIGEKTAAKIIALREKKGAFCKIEELMEIKGIKDKKLSKIRRYVHTGRH